MFSSRKTSISYAWMVLVNHYRVSCFSFPFSFLFIYFPLFIFLHFHILFHFFFLCSPAFCFLKYVCSFFPFWLNVFHEYIVCWFYRIKCSGVGLFLPVNIMWYYSYIIPLNEIQKKVTILCWECGHYSKSSVKFYPIWHFMDFFHA